MYFSHRTGPLTLRYEEMGFFYKCFNLKILDNKHSFYQYFGHLKLYKNNKFLKKPVVKTIVPCVTFAGSFVRHL